MSVNTLMFDLDGTLLPMDVDNFKAAYFKSLNSFIYGYLGDVSFVNNMGQAVEKMYKDKDGSTTNMQKFIKYFNEVSAIKYDIYKRYVDDYYSREFDKLSPYVEKEALVKMIITEIKKKGYKLILASTPLFPEKAMEIRLKWAGLSSKDFEFISHIDNMHYLKPSAEFYKEILGVNDITEEECLMVGNDVEEDLEAASELGISTFYLNDYGINKNKAKIESPQGTYIQFYEWVKSLPKIKG